MAQWLRVDIDVGIPAVGVSIPRRYLEEVIAIAGKGVSLSDLADGELIKNLERWAPRLFLPSYEGVQVVGVWYDGAFDSLYLTCVHADFQCHGPAERLVSYVLNRREQDGIVEFFIDVDKNADDMLSEYVGFKVA